MSIPKPALVQAEPGRPVTAQAWNAVLGAVDALYDAVNALGGNAVMTPKDPAKDVEDEITLPDPVDPSEQLPGEPPSLADQMREYRLRLQDAADAG